ncbi:MAG: response regulator transcription factor [Aureispira sp.]|nr:response regulator transcription factor [Aureispira sp.]
MKLIQCVIVEDEKQTRNFLRSLLEGYCEDIEVVAEAADVEEAVVAIKKHQPDLVFLDIEMPRENGFNLYKYFDSIDFEVIFTTAYSQYAIKAIKLAALDYLIKPIALEELKEALGRFRDKQKEPKDYSSNHKLIETTLKSNIPQKIALPCADGYIFAKVDEIVRCQSDRSYTLFVLENKEQVWTSRNLGEYDNILSEYGFARVHRSHLINPKFIKKFVRKKTSVLIMEDDCEIIISATKRDELLRKFFL